MNNLSGKSFLNKSMALTVLILAVLACSLTPGTETTSFPQSGTVVPAGETSNPDRLSEIPLQVGYGTRGSFYEIYFSDPFNPAAAKGEGGPDVPLVAAINAARISVDVAAYNISLYSVQNALIAAINRGVQVRMVMESGNMDNSTYQALVKAGIPVIGDRREGLMHNKFMVIDRTEVWTGSMNFTASGAYKDNNNLVRIRSAKIAEDYTVEFEEMFTEDFFGPDAIAHTPYPQVTIDGVKVEVFFSPDDHVARRIVELLRSAKRSVYFMAYSFTANDFSDIIQQKAKNGLVVGGIMEEDQVKSNKGTEYYFFKQASLPVYLDGNDNLMHNKVFIIDENIVITGSYNFGSNAERINDENVVIFTDPQIASQYLAEFQRVYGGVRK